MVKRKPDLSARFEKSQTILAGSSGSWRFNDGYVNFVEPTVGQTNLQTWGRTAGSDYNSSQFFLNGEEKSKSGLDNEEGFPSDTGISMFIGAGYDSGGGILPYSGKIGEIILVNGINTEIRQKIEAIWPINGTGPFTSC